MGPFIDWLRRHGFDLKPLVAAVSTRLRKRGRLVDLPCRRVECDEIWSFCYSKQKNVPADKRGQSGYCDVWTWTALDADSKLVVSWLVGLRDATNARVFMDDMTSRLANRVQLTTDGHRPYL